MRYLSFFRRFKYILLAILSLGILTGNYFAFAGSLSKCGRAYEVWNNTTSGYVASSDKKYDHDCYHYYDKNVYFTLDNSDSSIVLDSFVYQFIDDVEYTDLSILNKKNIDTGDYSALKGNEIAISKHTADKFNLSIGDSLYLEGTSMYQIKYIFKYMYGIRNASVYSDDDVVFIGSSEKLLNENFDYAIFNDNDDGYLEIFSFFKFRNEIKRDYLIYFGSFLLIEIATFTLLCTLFNKEKLCNLKMLRVEGNMKDYHKDLFLIDLFNLFIPFAISTLIAFYFVPMIMYISSAVLFAFFYIFEIIYLRAKSS